MLNFGAVTSDNIRPAELPSWLSAARLREQDIGSNATAQIDERLAAARRWVAVCSHTLLPHQSPRGPIVALYHAGDAQLGSWLHDEGWTVPITLPQPNHADRTDHPPAAWPGPLRGAINLLGAAKPILSSGGRAVLPVLRSDGSARPSFWRAKSMQMLIGAAGSDFATARAPADLALLADAQIAPLARRLAAAGLTFDQIDPAAATPARLAPYTLVFVGSALAEQPGMRIILADCPNLALIGARPGALASAIQIADDISADYASELIEVRGGYARYAWADIVAMEVNVRYGAEYTYVFVHNRQMAACNGMLAYRAPGGDVLHVHIGIGANRSGIIMLREDEVVGAAIDGEGAEGGWLARGLTSSMVFNAGAGGVAPCGHGLLITAPQSGRFQIRRSAGWDAIQAYRLMLSGELIEARVQIDAAHVLLPYIAEDDQGQSDLYLLLPGEQALPAELRMYLATPLHARALDLESAAMLATNLASEAAPGLRDAANALAAGAARLATIDDYAAAWRQAGDQIRSAVAALQADDMPRTSIGAAHTIDRILRLVAGEA